MLPREPDRVGNLRRRARHQDQSRRPAAHVIRAQSRIASVARFDRVGLQRRRNRLVGDPLAPFRPHPGRFHRNHRWQSNPRLIHRRPQCRNRLGRKPLDDRRVVRIEQEDTRALLQHEWKQRFIALDHDDTADLARVAPGGKCAGIEHRVRERQLCRGPDPAIRRASCQLQQRQCAAGEPDRNRVLGQGTALRSHDREMPPVERHRARLAHIQNGPHDIDRLIQRLDLVQ